MPNLLDPISESAKILYIGDQGHGKTGSKAALVAAGYKLRMIDTDRGFKVLRSLLTDRRYPYADYMKKAGIDPNDSISYIPIDVPIGMMEVSVATSNRNKKYSVLAPIGSAAWEKVTNLLGNWEDGENKFGPITDWGPDVVLDFDTLSTLAELAFYWIQDMNGRLGALEDDHGRDSGAAQELIRRLMTKLTSTSVRCNVIVTSHITRVDTSRGAALSPEMLLREHKSVDPRGYPTVIGRALSPVLGKKWNDVFIVQRTGNTATAERKIYTVPTDNTDAKNSVWLEPSYPLSTGLAEIFAALQYKDPPLDLIRAIRGENRATDQNPDAKPSGFGVGGKPVTSGFGARRNP